MTRFRRAGIGVVTTVTAIGLVPGGVTVPPSSIPTSEIADTEGTGLTVTDQTVVVRSSRLASVTVDRDDPHGHGRQTHGYPSVEINHDGAPEMLILPDVAPATTLAIRSREDGEWTDWILVTADPNEAPDGAPGGEGDTGGAVGIGPIWVGHDADRSEVAVIDGAVGELRVEELDVAPTAGTTPSGVRTLRANATTPTPASRAVASTQTAASGQTAARPAIQPRSAWATPDMGWQCSGGPSRSQNVTTAVVHHTASTTSYSPADVPDIIRGFWRYHAKTNGWCDIAYNFLVDRYGTIWEGRAGGIDQPVIGGHAKGFNTSTTGVALIGEFSSSPAYRAMIDATSTLLAWKLSLHGVDPLGWTVLQNRSAAPPLKFPFGALVAGPTIRGHRDLGQTSCPGVHVYDALPAIRSRLSAARRLDRPPYVFDRWRAANTGAAMAVVDAKGGIRVAGAATQTPTAVSGTPVAVAGGGGRGYVLTTDGRLTPFSGAPPRSAATIGTPVDLIVRSDGQSGWILDRDGRVAGFGGMPSSAAAPTPGRAVAIDSDDDANGYLLLVGGTLFPFGSAPARSISSTGGSPVLDIVVRADRASGWVLTADGVTHGFGGTATFPRPGGSSAARAMVLAGDESGPLITDADGRIWPVGGAEAVSPVASHVGTPDTVSAGDIGRAGLISTDTGKVVVAQHEFFLRATPTTAEFEKWFHTTGRLGRTGAALGMARSDQYAGLIIDDLYRRVLDRSADPAGRAGWLGAIRAGERIETIASAFYGSREYVQRAGSTDRFVELLYENLLFRASDAGGKANWIGVLRRGEQTPTQVAAGFYNSLESRRDRVARLYQSVLLRDPDPGGLAHWAQRLLTSDDIVLAADLAGSQEFFQRVLQGTR